MLKTYINYIKDNPHGYWFKAKIYGWGWTPAKWQGWMVLLIYVGLVFFFARMINEQSSPRDAILTFLLPIALLTIALIVICYKTGERPHWQWGVPKNKKDA